MGRQTAFVRLFALLLLAAALPARAEMTAQAKQELQAAYKDVNAALQKGPQDIKLGDQAVLKLPESYGFIPNPSAKRLMAALGNQPGEDLMGLVVPLGEDQDWLIDIEFEKSGYIKDDDAKHWNVDELLDNLKQGTEEANKERSDRGIAELEIVGWVQKPEYAPASHHLIWSLEAKEKGAAADQSPVVNYNTYVLGREGYISMDLITDMASVQGYTGSVRILLDDLEFDDGKQYENFNSSTDKVAEYGLAALIGGVALKKLGFFALAAAFLVKIWKLLLVVLVGGASALRKFFKGNTTTLKPPSSPTPPSTGGNLK
jgi:uncharacterized membrane-anchored protein